MKNLFAIVFICMLGSYSNDVYGQKRSRKKKDQKEQELFVPPKANTSKKSNEPYVSPVRKALNQFNFSLETGGTLFDYKHELTDATLVRNPRGDLLYIIPAGQERTFGPFDAYSNWFNDLTPVEINRIDDDAEIFRTDSTKVIYENSGRATPITLRVSFSIKKFDREHFKTTGNRRFSEDELVRIGGGVSFSSTEFRNKIHVQNVHDRIGSFRLPVTKTSATKYFGSVTYNAYQRGDWSLQLDVLAGTWKMKAADFNKEAISYDPFFNIGIIMEKRFSKYFKVYIRPAVEFRNYTIPNDQIDISHKMTLFSLNLGFLVKYPTYPRNKYKAHHVQMEHVFGGRIYRGRSIFRRQNPRIGQNYIRRKN